MRGPGRGRRLRRSFRRAFVHRSDVMFSVGGGGPVGCLGVVELETVARPATPSQGVRVSLGVMNAGALPRYRPADRS